MADKTFEVAARVNSVCVCPAWAPCGVCVRPVWIPCAPPPLRWLASFGCPPLVLTDSLRAARCSSFHASASLCGPILAMVPRPVHAAGGGLRAPSTALLAAAQLSSGQAAADMRSAALRDCLLSGAAAAGATGRDGDSGICGCTAPPDSRAGAPTGQRATLDSFTDISDKQSAEPTDWTRPTRRRAVRHKINAPRLAAIESEAFDAADVDVKTSRSRAASKSHKRAALKIVAISDAESDCRAAVPALQRAQHAWKELRAEERHDAADDKHAKHRAAVAEEAMWALVHQFDNIFTAESWAIEIDNFSLGPYSSAPVAPVSCSIESPRRQAKARAKSIRKAKQSRSRYFVHSSFKKGAKAEMDLYLGDWKREKNAPCKLCKPPRLHCSTVKGSFRSAMQKVPAGLWALGYDCLLPPPSRQTPEPVRKAYKSGVVGVRGGARFHNPLFSAYARLNLGSHHRRSSAPVRLQGLVQPLLGYAAVKQHLADKHKIELKKHMKWCRGRYDKYESVYGFKHEDDVGDNFDSVFMVRSPTTWDSRICMVRPYDGGEIDWGRFRRDFILKMGGEFTSQADADSLGMTLNGTDVGGINGPALDPVVAGGADGAEEAGLRRSAVVQRRRRLAKLYMHLLHHVIQPELRTMISDHCDAVAPFNGYVAYQKLKLHCHREPNDMTVMALIKQFNDAKFSDVGMSAETISEYVVYLATINADLPVGSKRTESDIAVKLPSGYDPKSNLGMIAMTEHSAPEAERRFWCPAVAAAAGVPAQPASRDLQRIQ